MSGNVQGTRVMEYIRFKGHSLQKGLMGAEICFCRDFFAQLAAAVVLWIIQLWHRVHRVPTIGQTKEHAIRVGGLVDRPTQHSNRIDSVSWLALDISLGH